MQHCETFKTFKVLDKHRDKTDFVSNYYLIEKLSQILPQDYDIVTSDGSANVITMQVIELKDNQRLITNTGCAPMGYGLPCAVGVASTGQKNILDIVDVKTQMQSIWSVLQYENEYNPQHNHSNCQISAVLYLKIPAMKPRNIPHKQDKDGNLMDNKYEGPDHLVDSLRYVLSRFTGKRTVKIY